MIIGISGKIGSGKDTTAALIYRILLKEKFKNYSQEFIDYLIPTYDEILKEPQKITSSNLINWKRRFFADIPKEFICSKLINKPREFLENRHSKESFLKEYNMTARDIMVGVGDGLREKISDDVWVYAFWNSNSCENMLITDVRYPNEANSIIERGGIVIRVWSEHQQELDYKSEIGLDDYNFKYVLKNDTLEKLEQELYDILKYEVVI